MKLRNLIAFISFAAFTSLVSSCGDDYTPITLVSEDGKTTYINNDTISLIKFTDGEKFNIKGGNGKYNIEVKDKSNDEEACIEDGYSSSTNTLTLKPKNEGECFLYVSDAEENSTRILVQVKNMNRLYTIKEIIATATGGELKINEQEAIEGKILNKALASKNGKFEFYYTNQNFDSGFLTIYPTENTNSDIQYFFYQKEPYFNPEGNEIIEFNLYESLGQAEPSIAYNLIERKDDGKVYRVLSEDVTEEYKSSYPKLEKATLEYILETTPTSDKKDNDK